MMNISSSVYWLFEILLLRILFRSVPHFFKIGLFGLLVSHFLSSLYILKISPLPGVMLTKNFSHSIGWCFVLFVVFFAMSCLWYSLPYRNLSIL